MGSADGRLARSRELFRRHAIAVDVATSAALTVAGVVAAAGLQSDKTVAITVVGAIACTTAVSWRRLAPTSASSVVLTAVAVYQISGHDPQGAFVAISVVLSLYALGRWATPRRQLAVAAVGLVTVTSVQIDSGFSLGNDLLTWVPVVLVPMLAGAVVTRRAAMARELQDKQGRLQDENEIAQARAVAEERSRVARELHDVVAHCVSVMVIQAGAARLHVRTDLAAARTAMQIVAACGRDALADLRRLVGPWRRTDDADVVASPRIAELPEFVAQVRDSGTAVRLHLDVDIDLPADLDLAVYRIVVESLTNVRKHAPSAAAEVDVTLTETTVEITVADTGPKQLSVAPGTGNGLIGMRERAALHRGELQAGVTPAGGFVVRAHLPLAPSPTAATVAPEPSDVGLLWRPTGRQIDVMFLIAWLVPGEIEAITSTHRTGALAWNIAAVAVMALAVLVRRRLPLLFVTAIGALTAALSGGIAAPQRASVIGTYALVVGAYTVGAYCGRVRALVGLGGMVATVIGMTAVHHAAGGVAVGGALLACVIWLAGRIVRDQRLLLGELRAVSSRLAAEHVQRTLVAAREERVRIARDLQTIVAQLMTTMVVQSEAVTELLGVDEDAAVDVITAVEHAGRDALTQLRLVLGVLRNESDPAPRHPQHGSAVTRSGGALAAVRPA